MFLQPIYAKYFGLGLPAIAAVLLIARIFDAVTDPVIGFVTDRYKARYGSPRLIIIAGGMIMGVSAWFLMAPAGYSKSNPDFSVSVYYFGFWYLLFYLGYTIFDMPHTAWVGDIAKDSDHKTTILAYGSALSHVTGLIFYAIPLLPLSQSQEFTPETLKTTAVLAVVLLPLTLWAFRCWVTVADVNRVTLVSPKRKSVSIFAVYVSVFKNPIYRIFFAAQICSAIGASMYFALLFFFVDGYLGLGDRLSIILIAGFIASTASLKLWHFIAKRWEKKHSWGAAMLVVVAGMVGAITLTPINGVFVPLLVCVTLIKCGFTAFAVMALSILSDISEYGTLRNGTDNSTSYFAVFGFVSKSISAMGGAAALVLIAWFQFNPEITVQSEQAIFGLKLTFSVIPAFFMLLTVAIIWRLPLNKRRHDIIRRRNTINAVRAVRAHKAQLDDTRCLASRSSIESSVI